MNAVEGVLSTATARLGSLEQALHELSTARARVTHPSGVVTVEVTADGLTGLWITESVTGVAADDVGRAVTEAAAAAAELLTEQRDRSLASLRARLCD